MQDRSVNSGDRIEHPLDTFPKSEPLRLPSCAALKPWSEVASQRFPDPAKRTTSPEWGRSIPSMTSSAHRTYGALCDHLVALPAWSVPPSLRDCQDANSPSCISVHHRLPQDRGRNIGLEGMCIYMCSTCTDKLSVTEDTPNSKGEKGI